MGISSKKSLVSPVLGILAFAALAPGAASATNLDCQMLPQLFEVYLRSHYSVKTMNDQVRTHAVEQFVKNLDPSKLLFLQSDVDRFRKELPSVFVAMQTEGGSCEKLTEVVKLAATRAKEEEDFVRSMLGADYKLDNTVELVTDPEKRGYPKTEEDKKAVLRKMVHFQISNYLVADTKLPEAKKLLVHRYELMTKRASERKASDALVFFAEAFALALDPHSSYLSKENLDDFQIQMRLSLEGIGASLSSDNGFTVIEDLIPGGGAEKSKLLLPKDKIIAVAQDGQSPTAVIDMDLKDVVKLIRGKKGTKVKLTILRQAKKSETFDVTIVRDKIDIKDQAAKITYETRKVGGKNIKVGVIDLPSFYGGGSEKGARSAYNDVAEMLEQAKKEKVDGVILNLSRNGGGLLEDAVRISGLFLKRGAVVATKDANGKVDVLSDRDDETQYSGPLVVLTSRLSASASEILAGALKDYRRAVIVGGDHTFGKGSVQVLSQLPLDLGAMKVTTGMFFLPGGVSTQHRGVASDIILPSVYSNDDVGEKTLDYSLQPQSIPTFVSKDTQASEAEKRWDALSDGTLQKLAQRSSERVSKDPKFADIVKDIEESNKNKGIIRLADTMKKAETDAAKGKKKNKKDETRQERMQKVKDLDAPYVQEGVNIIADLIALRQS